MNVENLKKKSVPVKVLTDVEIVEGYVADRLVQNYAEIVIEGPEDAVNEISYAQAILKRENVRKARPKKNSLCNGYVGNLISLRLRERWTTECLQATNSALLRFECSHRSRTYTKVCQARY